MYPPPQPAIFQFILSSGRPVSRVVPTPVVAGYRKSLSDPVLLPVDSGPNVLRVMR